MSLIGALVSNPRLVLQHRNIFLLSHMRANTSLFGHLVGSHPQIEGYYEMHIGYYSWRSLWRQKLLHFAGHAAKPQARYMFDKVLHDGHSVALDLLQREHSKVVLMLRSPAQSIKSLIVLYREHHPHLPEATAEGATRYYVDRLATLDDLASRLGPRYFYLDAECLITQTEPTLARLSAWLGLTTPIASEYKTFAQTGRGDAGDPSSRLKTGRIERVRSDYSAIELPAACTERAEMAYQACRRRWVEGSDARSTV